MYSPDLAPNNIFLIPKFKKKYLKTVSVIAAPPSDLPRFRRLPWKYVIIYFVSL
jgi:hypothetical protein